MKALLKIIEDLQDVVREMKEIKVVVIERDYKGLTEREMQVIQLSCHGLSAQQIGQELGISHRTVEAHRFNVLEKLQCKNWAQVICLLFKTGIIK